MATIASGSRMPRSSVNFSRGRILPRATPVRSGTRHSISVTRRSLSQFSSSLKVKFSRTTMGHLLGCLALAASAAGGAEGGQDLHRHRVVLRLPFWVPLHAEVEAGCIGLREGLDDAIGRARLDPEAS